MPSLAFLKLRTETCELDLNSWSDGYGCLRQPQVVLAHVWRFKGFLGFSRINKERETPSAGNRCSLRNKICSVDRRTKFLKVGAVERCILFKFLCLSWQKRLAKIFHFELVGSCLFRFVPSEILANFLDDCNGRFVCIETCLSFCLFDHPSHFCRFYFANEFFHR